MFSIGGAVLVEVVVCIGAIAYALWRLHAELEPARRSFDRLQRELAGAVDVVSRDVSRSQAAGRLLKDDR